MFVLTARNSSFRESDIDDFGFDEYRPPPSLKNNKEYEIIRGPKHTDLL